MKIDTFLKNLSKLLDEHDLQITGQMLVSPKQFDHKITYEKQAFWGSYPVHEHSAIVVVADKPVEEPMIVQKQNAFQIIRDDLGLQGVFNHADGKKYDSKSQYYKAVKASGCEVLGTDAPRDVKPVEPKINMDDLKRDIAQSIQQLGG